MIILITRKDTLDYLRSRISGIQFFLIVCARCQPLFNKFITIRDIITPLLQIEVCSHRNVWNHNRVFQRNTVNRTASAGSRTNYRGRTLAHRRVVFTCQGIVLPILHQIVRAIGVRNQFSNRFALLNHDISLAVSYR